MANTEKSDLDKYIEQVCKKAGMSPDNEYDYSLSIKEFLKIIVIQNWNPFLYPGVKDIEANRLEFLSTLTDPKPGYGIAPKEKLYDFILNISDHKFWLDAFSNIEYVLHLTSNLNSIFSKPTHAFFFGEPESTAELLTYYLDAEFGGGFNPFEGRQINCSHDSDDILLSKLFGHVKGTVPDEDYAKRGLLEKHPYGFLLIDSLEHAGEQFLESLLRYMNDGVYSRFGDTIERRSRSRIICTVGLPYETLFESEDIKVRPDLYCIGDKHVFIISPLRHRRCSIPFLMYRAIYDGNYLNKTIGIPFILFKYWLTEHTWENNENQLAEEVQCFFETFYQEAKRSPINYIRNSDNYRRKLKDKAFVDKNKEQIKAAIEENKKAFFRIIDYYRDPAFIAFISNSELEPYDFIEPNEFLYKPFFYYALRYFDKEKNEWDFDPESIGEYLEKISSSVISSAIDVTAERDTPSEKAHHKNSKESGVIDAIRDMREKVGRLQTDKFPTPPGASWHQLKINIFDDEWANITIGDVTIPKVHYTKMHFPPGRGKAESVLPGALWELLKFFGMMPGNEISPSILNSFAKRYDDEALSQKIGTHVHKIYGYGPKTLKTKVSQLRGLLKSYFGIKGKPITDYDKSGSYKTRFTISVKI